jgi:hypothetical protein
MSHVSDAVGVKGVGSLLACCCGASAQQRVPAHRQATVRKLRSVTRRCCQTGEGNTQAVQ